jgi:hypothetical protein
MEATKSQMRPLGIGSDISADREHHSQGKASITHLSPQKASHTKCGRFVEAQAKQANEHDKQQDGVGREADESVKISNVRVGRCTSSQSGCRCNTDLGVDESRRSTAIKG